MKLVDFFKVFDDWHCGLNQLKKFNRIPFEWTQKYIYSSYTQTLNVHQINYFRELNFS